MTSHQRRLENSFSLGVRHPSVPLRRNSWLKTSGGGLVRPKQHRGSRQAHANQRPGGGMGSGGLGPPLPSFSVCMFVYVMCVRERARLDPILRMSELDPAARLGFGDVSRRHTMDKVLFLGRFADAWPRVFPCRRRERVPAPLEWLPSALCFWSFSNPQPAATEEHTFAGPVVLKGKKIPMQ